MVDRERFPRGRKRAFSANLISNPLKFRQAVSTTVKAVAAVVAPILPAVVVQAAKTIVSVVAAVVDPTFSPSVQVNLPINVGPPSNKIEDSAFGPAYQIYEYTVPDGDPDKNKFAQELNSILDELLPEDDQPKPGVKFYWKYSAKPLLPFLDVLESGQGQICLADHLVTFSVLQQPITKVPWRRCVLNWSKW